MSWHEGHNSSYFLRRDHPLDALSLSKLHRQGPSICPWEGPAHAHCRSPNSWWQNRQQRPSLMRRNRYLRVKKKYLTLSNKNLLAETKLEIGSNLFELARYTRQKYRWKYLWWTKHAKTQYTAFQFIKWLVVETILRNRFTWCTTAINTTVKWCGKTTQIWFQLWWINAVVWKINQIFHLEWTVMLLTSKREAMLEEEYNLFVVRSLTDCR